MLYCFTIHSYLFSCYLQIKTLELSEDLTGAVFKYESFILHVQCRTLQDAQTLVRKLTFFAKCRLNKPDITAGIEKVIKISAQTLFS